jgi:hypothetical protein
VHVFTTTSRIAPGSAGAALARATARTREIRATTGVALSPWIKVYGAPPDTITFAARVDAFDALDDALAALDTDDPARCLLAHPTNFLGELVTCTQEGDSAPLFAEVVATRCEPGRTAEVIAWATETATHIARQTGLRTAVLRELSGPGASLARVTGADTLAELDAIDEPCPLEGKGPRNIRRVLMRRLR